MDEPKYLRGIELPSTRCELHNHAALPDDVNGKWKMRHREALDTLQQVPGIDFPPVDIINLYIHQVCTALYTLSVRPREVCREYVWLCAWTMAYEDRKLHVPAAWRNDKDKYKDHTQGTGTSVEYDWFYDFCQKQRIPTFPNIDTSTINTWIVDEEKGEEW